MGGQQKEEEGVNLINGNRAKVNKISSLPRCPYPSRLYFQPSFSFYYRQGFIFPAGGERGADFVCVAAFPK